MTPAGPGEGDASEGSGRGTEAVEAIKIDIPELYSIDASQLAGRFGYAVLVCRRQGTVSVGSADLCNNRGCIVIPGGTKVAVVLVDGERVEYAKSFSLVDPVRSDASLVLTETDRASWTMADSDGDADVVIAGLLGQQVSEGFRSELYYTVLEALAIRPNDGGLAPTLLKAEWIEYQY